MIVEIRPSSTLKKKFWRTGYTGYSEKELSNKLVELTKQNQDKGFSYRVQKVVK
jgi:hypothetical protein